MTRAQDVGAVGIGYDVTNPPAGVRLAFGAVAARLKVTITEMAQASGISRTAIADLLTNRWPVRSSPDDIRRAIGDLLEQHGATDEELLRLWHAEGRGASVRRKTGTTTAAATLPMRQLPAVQASATDPDQDQKDTDMLPMKATLTAAARRHFRLFTDPFNGPVCSDEQMFRGAEFEYVREAAWQSAQNAGFVAIVGESGAGKTTVLEDLQARLLREQQQCIVFTPSVVGMEQDDNKGKTLKAADLMHAIVSRLAPDDTMPQTPSARSLKAKRLLAASSAMGNTHLLLIEEAHCMPNETLKHLKRLNEIREGRRGLVGILLLAQPELKKRLSDDMRDGRLREVAQRCEVVELLPLDGDIKPYLQTRAAAAKVDLARIVTDDGIDKLRQRLTLRRDGGAVSLCYPLAVNNLLVRAMNAAAELGVPVVNADVVAAA
jgi:type II secretory pathway predicted ATPase ExeA